MNKFAPIGPPQLLRRLREEHGDSVLGYYHLVIAHEIVNSPEEWKDLFPPQSTVILDNGTPELGSSVDISVIEEAANILTRNTKDIKLVIVLPDVPDNSAATYIGSTNFWHSFTKKPGYENVEYMYVLQGLDAAEIKDAVLDVLRMIGPGCIRISWIGIPRRVCDNLGTRLLALLQAREVKVKYPHFKIQLLGFSNNIRDDVYCAREQGVEGIDSAVPLRLGQSNQHVDFSFIGDQAGPRAKSDFWTSSHTSIKPTTIHNLLAVRRAIRDSHNLDDYTPRLKQENTL
jgi:hypothetical protein